MPIASTGSVSASELYNNWFGISGDGEFHIDAYYKGGSDDLGRLTVPDVTENAGHPSSGAISYSDFRGIYGWAKEEIQFTAGTSGSLVGYKGFFFGFGGEPVDFGTVEVDDTWDGSLNSNIVFYSYYINTSTNKIHIHSYADDNRDLWKIDLLNASFTVVNSSPVMDYYIGTEWGFNKYEIPYVGSDFLVNGAVYYASIHWIK